MLTRLMHAACSSWPLDAVSLWQAGFPPADARPTARRHLPGQQLHLGGRLAGRPEGGTRDREAETARLQKTGRVESGTAEPGERGLGLPGWGGGDGRTSEDRESRERDWESREEWIGVAGLGGDAVTRDDAKRKRPRDGGQERDA
jgi:hypothetical protein